MSNYIKLGLASEPLTRSKGNRKMGVSMISIIAIAAVSGLALFGVIYLVLVLLGISGKDK